MIVADLLDVIDEKCVVNIYTRDYRLNSYDFEGLTEDIPKKILYYNIEKIDVSQKFNYDGVSYRTLVIQVKKGWVI